MKRLVESLVEPFINESKKESQEKKDNIVVQSLILIYTRMKTQKEQ